MRILVLTPEYLPSKGGGIITFYRNLLPSLVASGHSVRVLQGSGVFAADDASRTIIDGVHVEVLEQGRLQRHRQAFKHYDVMPGLRDHLAAAWAMWEQAGRGNDADVVEACDWGLSFIPPVLAGTHPVLVQMHGSIGQIDQHDAIAGEELQGILIRLIETAALPLATRLQTYSTANAQFWQQQLTGPVHMTYPAWKAPDPAGSATEISPSGLVLGRVQQWKGPHELCQALARLGDRAPAIEWVGRDTPVGERGRSYSAALAEQHPAIWGQRIAHRPPVAPDKAWALQQAARFNLVPSTWDVFNFTCAEAMGSGRPVICSSGAGASELIEDGVNGFVFMRGDTDGFARALDRVLGTSQAQLDRVGLAAQETVRRELDPDRIARLRISAYEETIAAFKPRAALSNSWLLDACAARQPPSREMAFLDHLPLRALMKYAATRAAKKISRGSHD